MSVPPGAESGPPPLSSAPRVRGYRRCLSGTIPRSNGCGRVVCRPPLIRRVTLKKVSRTYDGLIGKLSPAAAFAWSDTSPHSSSQSGHARAGAPALHTLQQNSSQFFMMEHRNPSVGWFNVAETQQTEKQPIKTNGIEVLETREWLDSLDYVLSHGGPDRAGRLLQQLALHARREAGINLPFSATTPYQNTIPSRQQPPFPGSQEMERRIKSLVRWNAMAMVVRANKIQEGIGGHALRSGVQSLFSGIHRIRRPRCRLFSGARRARNLRPRLPRGPYPQRETGELPAGVETRRRAIVVSASLAHARLLGISDRVDGSRPDSGDLSCAVHQVSGKSRIENLDRRESLGVSGRWRNGRTGIAWLDNAGFAGAARQPYICRELQSTAPRRTGTRKRQDHPGTGSDFPRRGMERHQADLGRRLGPAHSGRSRWPARPAHGRDHRRPVSEILRRERGVFPAEFLRPRSPAAENGRASFGRATRPHAARRSRPDQSACRVQGCG